jgi:hypothetical protein
MEILKYMENNKIPKSKTGKTLLIVDSLKSVLNLQCEDGVMVDLLKLEII